MPIDVLAKITHGYYQLTTAEKKVADYVLLHTWETQYMSISELAEACDVAEASAGDCGFPGTAALSWPWPTHLKAAPPA